MTDIEFQKLLNNLAASNAKYKRLLTEAESECERRYGTNPSDVDNDTWIDNFHVGIGRMTVEQVKNSFND